MPFRSTVLVQNQGEMLKSGRLETPYKGIVDCATRTYADEGLVSCTFDSDDDVETKGASGFADIAFPSLAFHLSIFTVM